jgi:Ca2+-binding RTX toxin-like protein
VAYSVSTERPVNAYTDSRQSASAITPLPDGGYVVVWSGSGREDPGYGVYAQRYDAAGDRVGGETLVNTTTLYSQRDPYITPLASGGYAVSWDSTVPGGGSGDPNALGVFVQVFDATANKIGTETRVTGSGGTTGQPLVPLADGGFVVLWAEKTNGLWDGVLARRFDSAGRPVGEAQVLDLDVNATLPTAAPLQAGYLAAWQAYDGASGAIVVQAFTADGARTGAELRLAQGAAPGFPEMIRLADGGFAVVWRQGGALHGQILSASGSALGQPVLMQPAVGSDQLLHTLAATPDGGFTVAWEQFGAGGASVHARAFNADGSSNGDVVLVRERSGAQGDGPGLALLSSGDLALSYTRYAGDVAQFFDVFQVRLEPFVRTFRGTSEGDVLSGTAGSDRLLGFSGPDALTGGAGADLLFGSQGADTLSGGDGNDSMFGGRDNDQLSGGAGADYVLGDLGDDLVQGDAGADVLSGGDGADRLEGGADVDLLYGGPGSDTLGRRPWATTSSRATRATT